MTTPDVAPQPDTEEAELPSRPTISIYQNSEHVAGLVQQLFDSPLVTEQVAEKTDDGSTEKSSDLTSTVKAGGKFGIPGIGKAGVDADLGGSRAASQIVATGSKSTQTFVYSQAYYLNIVRRELSVRGLLKQVASGEDAAGLQPGDFVEYRASFTASELTTIADVLTPDLVAVIAKSMFVRSETAGFQGYESFAKVQAAALAMDANAEARAGLAREIAIAVKAAAPRS